MVDTRHKDCVLTSEELLLSEDGATSPDLPTPQSQPPPNSALVSAGYLPSPPGHPAARGAVSPALAIRAYHPPPFSLSPPRSSPAPSLLGATASM